MSINSVDAGYTGTLTIDLGQGFDSVGIHGLASSAGTLTINGGTDSDSVSLLGSLTFAAGSNLDIDLQNDDPTPGDDEILVVTGRMCC